ncbi:MAG: cupin domain-containing protein [Spirochaetales bacterium]|nr:cupin domain-containing protein [Spirochaetales bacterium]
MPTVIHEKQCVFETNQQIQKEYSWEKTQDLAKEAGMEDFSCTIKSLPQGSYSYPFHYHHNSNEMFVILSGKGELRDGDGIQNVNKGDIVFCEKGSTGAHQLHNPHKENLVYIDLRTLNKFDLCEYPDTGKINNLKTEEIYFKGKSADYFQNENQVDEIWENLR